MTGKRFGQDSLTFTLEREENGTLVASVVQTETRRPADDTGALYYVLVVILIYGCSIIFMIASYTRKSNADRNLSTYVKEMAAVRRRAQMQHPLTTPAQTESRLSTASYRHDSCATRNTTLLLEDEVYENNQLHAPLLGEAPLADEEEMLVSQEIVSNEASGSCTMDSVDGSVNAEMV